MQWDVPFSNLTAGPELRECFVKCKLPQQGLELAQIVLENSDAHILATWPVEVIIPFLRVHMIEWTFAAQITCKAM